MILCYVRKPAEREPVRKPAPKQFHRWFLLFFLGCEWVLWLGIVLCGTANRSGSELLLEFLSWPPSVLSYNLWSKIDPPSPKVHLIMVFGTTAEWICFSLCAWSSDSTLSSTLISFHGEPQRRVGGLEHTLLLPGTEWCSTHLSRHGQAQDCLLTPGDMMPPSGFFRHYIHTHAFLPLPTHICTH